jgi:hypothetical protein
MNVMQVSRTIPKNGGTKMILFALFISLLQLTVGCKKEGGEITSVVSNDTIPRIPGWNLIWNDEFNGTSVD